MSTSSTDRPYDVAVIVGSNRSGSINRQLAQALLTLAPAQLRFRSVAIDALPFYNGDLEGQRPESVLRFVDEVARAQALLIVTPEYNRSIPALLKNAIDWGSKPMESNVWRDKSIAICGTSPGAIGTAAAQLHLRQILSVLSANVMSGEAYIQFKPGLIDAEGKITVESTQVFLSAYMTRFGHWVTALAASG